MLQIHIHFPQLPPICSMGPSSISSPMFLYKGKSCIGQYKIQVWIASDSKTLKPNAQYHFCNVTSDEGNDFSHHAIWLSRLWCIKLVTAKYNTAHACMYVRMTRWITCAHTAQWVAHRITKVEHGSTPAICLVTALRQPSGKSVSVRKSRSRCRSNIVHRA